MEEYVKMVADVYEKETGKRALLKDAPFRHNEDPRNEKFPNDVKTVPTKQKIAFA